MCQHQCIDIFHKIQRRRDKQERITTQQALFPDNRLICILMGEHELFVYTTCLHDGKKFFIIFWWISQLLLSEDVKNNFGKDDM